MARFLSSADHLPALRQHHAVDPGHLHDALVDHAGRAAQVLRAPGLGNHFEDQPATAHLLQVLQGLF